MKPDLMKIELSEQALVIDDQVWHFKRKLKNENEFRYYFVSPKMINVDGDYFVAIEEKIIRERFLSSETAIDICENEQCCSPKSKNEHIHMCNECYSNYADSFEPDYGATTARERYLTDADNKRTGRG